MIATHNETGTGFAGLFTKVLDRIHTNVNVNLACGDPRTVGETTIIPVGVVSDGFGLGMGTRPNANADSQAARGFSRSRSSRSRTGGRRSSRSWIWHARSLP